jgi:AcrR family transcriptional regulator
MSNGVSRKYELKRRAERQEETRQRIVDAAIGLHEEEGIKASISAIAERAGVERPTVYRHFPDMRSIYSACTSSFYARNPIPDPRPWKAIADPVERLRTALSAIYAQHRRTEKMITRNIQLVDAVPEMQETLAPYRAKWQQIHQILASGWTGNQALIAAAIGHAMGILTWQSLVRVHGLSEEQAVDLMTCMVARCSTGLE